MFDLKWNLYDESILFVKRFVFCLLSVSVEDFKLWGLWESEVGLIGRVRKRLFLELVIFWEFFKDILEEVMRSFMDFLINEIRIVMKVNFLDDMECVFLFM